jgi:hypothetical protein
MTDIGTATCLWLDAKTLEKGRRSRMMMRKKKRKE